MSSKMDEKPMDDGECPGRGTRMFQIYETDLVELERIIPSISDAMMGKWSARQRTQLRRLKDILSSVRWNYGPHSEVIIIPCGEQPDGET